MAWNIFVLFWKIKLKYKQVLGIYWISLPERSIKHLGAGNILTSSHLISQGYSMTFDFSALSECLVKGLPLAIADLHISPVRTRNFMRGYHKCACMYIYVCMCMLVYAPCSMRMLLYYCFSAWALLNSTPGVHVASVFKCLSAAVVPHKLENLKSVRCFLFSYALRPNRYSSMQFCWKNLHI